MENPYTDLTSDEADDVLRGRIGSIICEALGDARGLSPEEWDDRDIFNWSYHLSGVIAVAIANRRRDGS